MVHLTVARASASNSRAHAVRHAQGVGKAHKVGSRHDKIPVLENAPHPHHVRAQQEESVIVTGTHSLQRHARDSISPIDVITAATLQRSGQTNIADALVKTNPSITVSAMGMDTAALTSEIRLRGLNPNETLVLVDGKRRHGTANINAAPGPQQGSTAPDLNMIPANMIDHIEVLRDGAAAMYGSDAIAGVINIITKKRDHGAHFTAQTGANGFVGGGWNTQISANGGVKILGDGYLNISGQFYHTDHAVVPTIDRRTGTHVSQFLSSPEETRENLGLNFGKPLNDKIDFYGQIIYGHRHAESYQYYRTPDVLPTIYPGGFSPLETIEENDYSATLGLKGDDFLGFHWDLSTLYGSDIDNIGMKSTGNPGLLSAEGYTPTDIHAESFTFSQWTNNLNFTRDFKSLPVPLTLSFGAEHRYESYELGAGNYPAYAHGGMAGSVYLMPTNAGAWNRDVWAGYIDTDLHPTKHWEVDLAGRFEHYTDFGNTENGKVSTRYEVSRRLAFRATVTNGFRAPTLAEEHFSTLNITPTGASALLPANSGAARVLGAAPLKPERSFSMSGGFTVEPLHGLHVAVDVYQINLRDRITGGGSYNGPDAINAIEMTGAILPVGSVNQNAISGSYFANAASTRTQGLDITADYLSRFGRFGNVSWTLGLNLNRTRISHVGTDGNNNPILNAGQISSITTASPRSKIVMGAYWTKGNWDVNVRETRWGETVSMLGYQDAAPPELAYSNKYFYQFKNTPVWVTDLEIGYRATSKLHVAIGGSNIFNMRPRKVPASVNLLGDMPYDLSSSSISPFGGYYYGRVDYSF